VAKNIIGKKGGRIIVVSEQFPSNVYPWQELAQQQGLELIKISPPTHLNERGKQWNENILNAIDENTVMVAIGNVHWADGTRFDLKRIRKATLEAGALLIIDGTQSVGALPFDVAEINPDALICAGYKWLMGPYSIGLAYYGEHFKNGQPLEHNWINRHNSEDFRSLVNYETRFQPGMTRYDMGEKSNFILVPMLLAAIEFLNETGPANIQNHCGEITKEALKILTESGWWVEDPEFRANHLFGLRPPAGVDIANAASRLLENNIYVSLRGEVIRVSPNIYNDHNDLIRMVEILCG
jgi:selenocysteine lyase/cysteine desulfurase